MRNNQNKSKDLSFKFEKNRKNDGKKCVKSGKNTRKNDKKSDKKRFLKTIILQKSMKFVGFNGGKGRNKLRKHQEFRDKDSDGTLK